MHTNTDMHGLSCEHVFMFCCLRGKNTSAALPFLSVPSPRLWTHLLPSASCACDPPVTPSPRLGTHTYSVHTQARKHKHKWSLLLCALREKEETGWHVGLYFRAEACKRRFFIVNLFPSPVKSCRTRSSTQCSVWVTALVSFWDLNLNYSCL